MLTLYSDLHYGLLEYPSLHGANAQVWSPAGGFTASVGRGTKNWKEESFLALPTLYKYYIKNLRIFQISRVKGYHICITNPSCMRRLVGPTSCSYRTLGLMLLFKGVCCTLTVHMARKVNHRSSTGAFSALYFRLRRSPLTLYIYYILNFQKSQK